MRTSERRIPEEADDKETDISDYLKELKGKSFMTNMQRKIETVQEKQIARDRGKASKSTEQYEE